MKPPWERTGPVSLYLLPLRDPWPVASASPEPHAAEKQEAVLV